MKIDFKRKIALFIAICSTIATIPANAATVLPSISESEMDEIHICQGMDPSSMEEFEIRENPNLASILNTNAKASTSTSCDNSTSTYFPPIMSQGSIGSCAACSTTYYQYTYTANSLNSIPSTSSNAYSPKWPYYFLNSTGENNGVSATNVYKFLSEHGSLIIEDYPYSTSFDSTLPLPTDTSLMREALGTRLSTWYSLTIPATGTVITSPTDSDLDDVKTLLSSGFILQVSSYYNFNTKTVDGELINYRCTTKDTGHSFVIVGYDDNFTYDINGNGTIETAEKGAFKMANSHGTNYGNDGFAWIMYDALNGTSAVSGTWENSLSGTRVAAFKFNSTDNYFTYIFAKNYDVNFVAELKFTGTIRNTVAVQLTSVNSSGTSKTRTISSKPLSPISSTFTLLYDYSTIGSPISSYALDSTMGIKLTGTKKTLSSGSKITDDRGNTLKNLSSTSTSGTYTANISFDRGDVNYDGTLNNNDATLITQYIAGYDNLSNVQKCLADYNNDGAINMVDAIALSN